jgi:uncharacterized protein
VTEQPAWIECGADRLLGIFAEAPAAHGPAVLIITGGPQYRVGSHRQFTLLARRLAKAGYNNLRFDVRGMGDSTGEPRAFTELDEDIEAALRSLAARGTARVVLLGLCDAASAALLYLARRRPPTGVEIAGVVLINPWVRSTASLAQAQLKHYYGARLVDRDFWRKVLRGRFNVLGSLRSFAASVFSAVQRTPPGNELTYQAEMAEGLRNFEGPVLLITSGNDLTAREFLDYATADPRWRGLLERPALTRHDLPEADHTFSPPAAGHALESRVLEWLTVLRPVDTTSVAPTERGVVAIS